LISVSNCLEVKEAKSWCKQTRLERSGTKITTDSYGLGRDELRRHHTALLCDDVVDGDGGARRRLASAEQCLETRQSREDLEEAHRGAVDRRRGGLQESRKGAGSRVLSRCNVTLREALGSSRPWANYRSCREIAGVDQLAVVPAVL
jgi:hypothetical protein